MEESIEIGDLVECIGDGKEGEDKYGGNGWKLGYRFNVTSLGPTIEEKGGLIIWGGINGNSGVYQKYIKLIQKADSTPILESSYFEVFN